MNLVITFRNFVVAFINVGTAFFDLLHHGEQKLNVFSQPWVVFLFEFHDLEKGIVYFVVFGHLFLQLVVPIFTTEHTQIFFTVS